MVWPFTSSESYWVVLACGAVYNAVQGRSNWKAVVSDGTVSYVVLTFESLLETLWFDHQNESHLAAHLQGATFFSFSILQKEFWNFVQLCGLFVLPWRTDCREWRDKIEDVLHASSLDEFLELLRQTVYKMFEQKQAESTLGFEPKIFVSAKTPYLMRLTEPRQKNHMKLMEAEQSGLTSSVSSALQPGCVCSLPSLKSWMKLSHLE